VRIAILSETFTKNMGYVERHLPRALARLGPEVHVVAANLQAYHSDPHYATTYEPFNGPAVQPCGTEEIDGFTLHRLPHAMLLGYVRIDGLARALRELRPDVVQTFAAASWIPLAAAASKVELGYELFTGAHQTASVMSPSLLRGPRVSYERMRSDVRRALPGRLVGMATTRCYAATVDCADVAVRFYGVPKRKVTIAPLGVDTDVFRPARTAAELADRHTFRERLGAGDGDMVCVYTGRFTAAKQPIFLARAVARLRAEGVPIRAWFFGDGPQSDEIAGQPGSLVHSFVPSSELAAVYRAADVGVWPTQESMSMLDAAACGLTIVVNDQLQARERVDGNGLTYRLGDVEDLCAVLHRLVEPSLRASLGEAGAQKVASQFSWAQLGRRRLSDYETALASRGVRR
jgi:glycosyltransferase involved in cell wall biosynthesis